MKILWNAARVGKKRALPILSFPATQKMNVTVRDMTQNAETQARAMAVIAEETPTIAAVGLMDLFVEAEAFGASIRFADNEVPAVISQLVDGAQAAEALQVPTLDKGRAALYADAMKRAKQYIPDKPVLAGAIGPYSLAGRLMDVTEIFYACFDDPEMVHKVLEKATDYIIAFCYSLKDAGADGVVMAEPLAGLLNPDMAEAFSNPYVVQILEAVQTEAFPVIYHNCGGATVQMLPQLFKMKAAAYHFGNAVDMETILKSAPSDALCMGNIDPAGQFASGTPQSIHAAVTDLMDKCAKYPNFLISSGCDIPAHASWENISAFFDAVADYNEI
ncbi:MAG: uroporphyrinogen decarboxylase family protein [Firmicutes bacterium]|nr:uroporphyrinogen decarboxylase family protein [Bacillota bacterium]